MPDQLLDWRLVIPVLLFALGPLVIMDQCEPRVVKSNAEERCMDEDDPEECLANVEIHHDDCYARGHARRTRARQGCAVDRDFNYNVYNRCISMGHEEYRLRRSR